MNSYCNIYIIKMRIAGTCEKALGKLMLHSPVIDQTVVGVVNRK